MWGPGEGKGDPGGVLSRVGCEGDFRVLIVTYFLTREPGPWHVDVLTILRAVQ